jgi:hypothetical protein
MKIMSFTERHQCEVIEKILRLDLIAAVHNRQWLFEPGAADPSVFPRFAARFKRFSLAKRETPRLACAYCGMRTMRRGLKSLRLSARSSIGAVFVVLERWKCCDLKPYLVA